MFPSFLPFFILPDCLRYEAAAVTSAMLRRRTILRLSVTLKDGSVIDFDSPCGFTLDNVQRWTDDAQASPEACMTDGLCNAIIFPPVHECSRARLLSCMFNVWEGRMLQLPEMRHIEAAKVVVEFDGAGLFNVDGENFFHDGRIEVDVLHRAFPLMLDRRAVVNDARVSE
eukprot:GHVU01026347.1.p2 GENE.GHVU01026347.1~~GHVU01026347.1.p2  ORF type:complete len:170 (+),score=31.33 GHVU01026347.1:165-674(+)